MKAYTDKNRVNITKQEYIIYKKDDDVEVDEHSIGTVKEVLTDDTCLKEVQR